MHRWKMEINTISIVSAPAFRLEPLLIPFMSVSRRKTMAMIRHFTCSCESPALLAAHMILVHSARMNIRKSMALQPGGVFPVGRLLISIARHLDWWQRGTNPAADWLMVNMWIIFASRSPIPNHLHRYRLHQFPCRSQNPAAVFQLARPSPAAVFRLARLKVPAAFLLVRPSQAAAFRLARPKVPAAFPLARPNHQVQFRSAKLKVLPVRKVRSVPAVFRNRSQNLQVLFRSVRLNHR